MSPWPAPHFVYQKDTTVPSYEKVLNEMKNDSSYGYCTILSSQSWKEYIKDPFNDEKTRAYLSHTVLESKKAKKPMNPPFGITFENLTTKVGPIKQQRRLLDVRHYNMYFLIPRLVYHLSIKLCRKIMSQRMGRKYEIELIQYLTRFGCATRTAPYCKLHGAYIEYTKVLPTSYINDCQDKEQIISVTLFLIMSFNSCFTYQKSKANNLLVDELDRFDLNTTLSNDMFMNTLSKYIHCSILFKFEIFFSISYSQCIFVKLCNRCIIILCL